MLVLRIDDKISLFESNAIAEYLDETIQPRLHPEDPIQRAVNRAWTDYVPTFAESLTGAGYAPTEEGYNKAIEKVPVAMERLEKALATQGRGAILQRREILAGRRQLRAVPATLPLSRSRRAEGWSDREIPACSKLGLEQVTCISADGAFLPRGGDGADVSRRLAASQILAVAICYACPGCGGINECSKIEGQPNRAAFFVRRE